MAAWSQAPLWSTDRSSAVGWGLLGVGFTVTAVLLFNQEGQRGNAGLFAALAIVWSVSETNHRPIGLWSGPMWILGEYTNVLAAAILLRYPARRLDSAGRVFVWVNYVLAAMFGIAVVATGRAEWQDYSGRWPGWWADRKVNDLVLDARNAWWCVAAAVFVILLARRWSRSARLERRTLLPIAAAAAIASAALGSAVLEPWLGPVVKQVSDLSRSYAGVVLSLSFVVSAVQLRLARYAVTDLVVKLSGPATLEGVRDALRSTLADPRLEVLYWVPERDSYIGDDGTGQDLPVDDATRMVVPARGVGDEPVAAVLVDAGLHRHRSLVESAVAVSALALENARLQAGLRAQLAVVREARARLLQVGLAERRRLERDLHDGAQQRLLAVGMRLGAIEARTTDPLTAEAIQAARAELHHALRELRDLAHGIYPAILAEAGLAAALEAVAERLPIPVSIAVATPRRHPDVESAAYLVACEALTNTVKHAGPCQARVTVDTLESDLWVEIVDTGTGFTTQDEATALPGLRDRLQALGGQLQVTTQPGHGTQVLARIPQLQTQL